MDDIAADVAVIGAGMGGIVAAVRAAELGRRVVLAEAGSHIGGTAMHSGGGVHIWGATSWDDYRRHCPQADPILAQAVFDQYAPLIRWLESTRAPGAYLTSTNRGLTLTKYQLGDSIAATGRQAWFDFMARRLKSLGGRILLDCRATALRQDGPQVSGFMADQDGHPVSVRADHVVLAAGGFQNAPQLLARFVATAGATLLNRGAATNRGDGLAMAQAVGAACSERMDTLYGHLLPAPPCAPRSGHFMDFLLLSAFYVEQAILIDRSGARFTDESAGELNGETINAAALRPPGDLWIVMDDVTRRDHARVALPSEVLRPVNWRLAPLARYLSLRRRDGRTEVAMDGLRYARDRHADILTADSITALADMLANRGVDRVTLLATIEAFNAAMRDGSPLDVPRAANRTALARPPFHAIRVGVGVSMTYGGVRIDRRARVLHRDGGVIKGLYAAPGTAGGVHYLHYAGALAACATFGMIAAETAAAEGASRVVRDERT